jgi:Pyridoxamine 5'-phosphate oxidase
MTSWGEFATAEPALASFGADRLVAQLPAYLATVREDGTPRVHPVTPVVTADGLFVFMESTSPKGRDLRERGGYALHSGVPDSEGAGGEFFVSGTGHLVEDGSVRAIAERAASYDPEARYVLFELGVSEARCNGYGDVTLPDHRRWRAD